MRRAARIDVNQPGIVKALRAIGASVQPLHMVGRGCADLLAGFRGDNFLLEIKNPDAPISDRELTPAQVEFHNAWRGTIHVIETAEQAIQVVTRRTI